MLDSVDCFFFSSRRRHTRCSRDWSSDVCSSDLYFARPSTRSDGPQRCHLPVPDNLSLPFSRRTNSLPFCDLCELSPFRRGCPAPRGSGLDVRPAPEWAWILRAPYVSCLG